jgi:hypothetical protein
MPFLIQFLAIQKTTRRHASFLGIMNLRPAMLDCAAVKAMTFTRLLSNAELAFLGVGYHRIETKKAELKDHVSGRVLG